MKKVVSIALFGEKFANYAQYLPSYLLAHLNLFPLKEDWRLRLHVDDGVANHFAPTFERLTQEGLIEIARHPGAPLAKAMLWRLAPVFAVGADYVFSRDLDACPTPRDRTVCDQFIISEAAIGTCHDNVMHAGIMGGLSHFRSADFRAATKIFSLMDLYRFAGERDWAHGADQDVLNRLVQARPELTLLEHRFNGWHNGAGKHPKRSAGQYCCAAWSTPTPDLGTAPALTAERRLEADLLGAHLGCAGFPHATAYAFWSEHGDPEIRKQVNQCFAVGALWKKYNGEIQ